MHAAHTLSTQSQYILSYTWKVVRIYIYSWSEKTSAILRQGDIGMTEDTAYVYVATQGITGKWDVFAFYSHYTAWNTIASL